ncbi:carbohydrate-binding module family 50 protein [Canariomyces notabilis]|uniref:chitinase n=1 Tax=Canariomyces notabilis TaxID=2074819 RepID=A0AAN6YXS2_9PEZI|nr:carbohydrate-binding module family 50 protein [Canariomyces arenarius]
MFTKTLALAAMAAAPALATPAVNVYWGQKGLETDRLRSYCDAPGFEYVTVGFVNKSPENDPSGLGYPGTDFSRHCLDLYYMDKSKRKSSLLSHCGLISADIRYCQKKGKKVLLSIGGEFNPPKTDYSVSSPAAGEYFANFIWGAFGPYDPSWELARPFDDFYSGADEGEEHFVFDGFDFDIEAKFDDQSGYIAMVNKLRELTNMDTSKKYLITAAPECPLDPRYFKMKDIIQKCSFDALFVQFYNNEVCEGAANNFDAWAAYLQGTESRDAKIFIGLPGSPQAAGSGYLDPIAARNLLLKHKNKASFGGVMVWDAFFGSQLPTGTGGKNYYQFVHDVAVGAPAPTTSSPPVPAPTDCVKTYEVKPNDLCYLIANEYGLYLSELLQYNPSLNSECTNLLGGQKLCVKLGNLPKSTSTTVATTTSTSTSASSTTTSASSTTTAPSSTSEASTTTSTSEVPSTTTSDVITPTSTEEDKTSTSPATSTSETSTTTSTSEVPSTTTSDVISPTSTEEDKTSTSPATSTSETSATTSTSEVPSTTTSDVSSTITSAPEVSSTTTSDVASSTSTDDDDSCEDDETTTSLPSVTGSPSGTTMSPDVSTTTTSSPSDSATPTDVSTTASASSGENTTSPGTSTTTSPTSEGSSDPTSIATQSYTTSTIYTTSTYTVTSCAPSVTSCPGRVVTETIAISTTVCPVTPTATATATATETSSPQTSEGGETWTTSTIYSTKTYTITSCPPSAATDCPGKLGQVTTELVAVTTTVCPVTTVTPSASASKPTSTAPGAAATISSPVGGSEEEEVDSTTTSQATTTKFTTITVPKVTATVSASSETKETKVQTAKSTPPGAPALGTGTGVGVVRPSATYTAPVTAGAGRVAGVGGLGLLGAGLPLLFFAV